MWLGDILFLYEVLWLKEESGLVNVGKLMMSIYIGIYIDVLFYFDNDGKKVLDLDV